MFYQVRHSERNSYIIEVGSRKKDLSYSSAEVEASYLVVCGLERKQSHWNRGVETGSFINEPK